MSLKDIAPADSYSRLLNVDNSNGIDGAVRKIIDGQGTTSSFAASYDRFAIQPYTVDTSTTFMVYNKDGSSVFQVDTAAKSIKASGRYVNTNIASFGISGIRAENFAANKHNPIPFSSITQSNAIQDDLVLGTGTDPDTTFTTSTSANFSAAKLATYLWVIPQSLTIDKVISVVGGDNANGDTCRMHLMSYLLTSGATACLTDGTVVAQTSDLVNAGMEQPYLEIWTIVAGAIASNRVLVATFRSDTINSNYTVNIQVQYHF